MKKFLASLLSLIMLCSSVAVFCSASDDCKHFVKLSNNSCSKIDCDEGYIFNDSTGTCDEKTAKDQGNNKTLKDQVNAILDQIRAFYNGHQKGIAITGIATGVVAIVGTTAYIFRNEVKDLAQKTTKTVKEISKKATQKINKATNVNNNLK